MGKIITVASQKGGVGKTTTTLNLSYSLSRFGDRVLLVDADPQGGMSLATNIRRKSRSGLVQLLRDPGSTLVVTTRDGTMGVLGSGIEDPDDAAFLEESARDGRLVRLLRGLSGGYAYVIVDAPAGIGGIVAALLSASHGVLLALRCQAIMLRSLPMLLRLVAQVRKNGNPALRLEGALITMFDARLERESLLRKEIEASLPPRALFRTVIPLDDSFEEASLRGVPVGMMAGAREPARSYLDLALELRDREQEGAGGAREHVEGLF